MEFVFPWVDFWLFLACACLTRLSEAKEDTDADAAAAGCICFAAGSEGGKGGVGGHPDVDASYDGGS